MAERPRNPRPGGPRPGGSRPGPRPGGPRPGGPRRSGPGGPSGGGFQPRRPEGDRPQRDFTDRPKRDFGDRPRPTYGDRPQRDFTDRPKRDFGDRPRPTYGDRPQRDFTDRPKRDFGDRPRDAERPPQFEVRPRRYQGPADRPRQEQHFDKPRAGYGRPVRSFDTRRVRTTQADGTSELLGPGEELIAGKRPVEEAFAARREAVRLLIVPERRAALDALAIHATTLRIPVVELEGGSLTALAGFDGHQGVALIARTRTQADLETILAHAQKRGVAPFVLILDSLEDPQNFGTLLRSAEACGVDGVIYPTHRAAPLSPAAIKASAGATEHLLLAPVDDLAGTLADLHTRGLRVVGADEDASLSYAEADLRGPLAIVVGSEGKGMSGPVKRRLDLVVRIPMRGRVASLNAAVAGSILLFAAAQQRPITAPPTTDTPDSAEAKPDAEVKPKRETPTTKSAPKPKRTTIQRVNAELMDGATEPGLELLPDES